MKSTIEKLSTLERKLNIEVPAGEVQAAFDKAFRGIQKRADIKGFRKGKAPLAMVRALYGEAVRQDVAQEIIQRSYAAALNQHELDPINYPTIEFDPLEAEKDFAFTAEFEVRPEVPVVHYEGIVVRKEKLQADVARADAVLEEIRAARAQTVPVLEDRGAQKGDVATIDFEGSLLTGPLEGGTARGHKLELGSDSFIPGFEEGLEGLRVGQEKTLSLAFPEAYHAKEIAGKPVSFKVKLTALEKKDLPALNDEFAAQLGPYPSLQAVREEILKDIEKREARRIEEDLRNRLMKALVERNRVDVPKSLHSEQKKALVEDLRKRMKQQGLDDKAFEEYKAKWDDDFAQTASFMIRSSLLVEAIAKERGLAATSAEIDAKIEARAKESGIETAKFREFYSEPSRSSRLAYQISEEKVLDFRLATAEIREVAREELEPEGSAARA